VGSGRGKTQGPHMQRRPVGHPAPRIEEEQPEGPRFIHRTSAPAGRIRCVAPTALGLMAYGTQPLRAGLTLLRAYGAEGGMDAEVRRGSGEKSLTSGRGELQGVAIGLEARRRVPHMQKRPVGHPVPPPQDPGSHPEPRAPARWGLEARRRERRGIHRKRRDGKPYLAALGMTGFCLEGAQPGATCVDRGLRHLHFSRRRG
jgi:hypothetical protein